MISDPIPEKYDVPATACSIVPAVFFGARLSSWGHLSESFLDVADEFVAVRQKKVCCLLQFVQKGVVNSVHVATSQKRTFI